MDVTNPHCPKCGSKAHQMSKKSHTVETTEFAFRCDNPECGNSFTGVMTLTVGRTSGQHFSQGTDEPVIKTDC